MIHLTSGVKSAQTHNFLKRCGFETIGGAMLLYKIKRIGEKMCIYEQNRIMFAFFSMCLFWSFPLHAASSIIDKVNACNGGDSSAYLQELQEVEATNSIRNMLSISHIYYTNSDCRAELFEHLPESFNSFAFALGNPLLIEKKVAPKILFSQIISEINSGSRSGFLKAGGLLQFLQKYVMEAKMGEQVYQELRGFIRSVPTKYDIGQSEIPFDVYAAKYAVLNDPSQLQAFKDYCRKEVCDEPIEKCILRTPFRAKHQFIEDVNELEDRIELCGLRRDQEHVLLRIYGILEGMCSAPLQDHAYRKNGISGAYSCKQIFINLDSSEYISTSDQILLLRLISEEHDGTILEKLLRAGDLLGIVPIEAKLINK